MNGIAERFLKQNDPRSALIIWHEMEQMMPDKAGVYNGLAKSYEAIKDTAKAIIASTKAVELAIKNNHPRLTEFQANLARLETTTR